MRVGAALGAVVKTSYEMGCSTHDALPGLQVDLVRPRSQRGV